MKNNHLVTEVTNVCLDVYKNLPEVTAADLRAAEAATALLQTKEGFAYIMSCVTMLVAVQPDLLQTMKGIIAESAAFSSTVQ